MKKTKYIASIWVPGYTAPGTDKPAPVDFERVVDHGTPAPFYETDNYTAIVVNLENGECRTYGNIQYRLIVKHIVPLAWEEFKSGVKFKTFEPSGIDRQILSFDLIDNKPRIIVHRRDRMLTPTNAIPVMHMVEGEYVEVVTDTEEQTVRLYLHEMYKHD